MLFTIHFLQVSDVKLDTTRVCKLCAHLHITTAEIASLYYSFSLAEVTDRRGKKKTVIISCTAFSITAANVGAVVQINNYNRMQDLDYQTALGRSIF